MNSTVKRIMAARTALVLDQPFFGVLALRLQLKADPGCGTAWVDGRTLGYEPSFIDGLSHAQLVGLIAHEVMHCACGHPWRRDARDVSDWNDACDYAVNPILVDANFTLPERAAIDPAFHGKSAEWIYDRLPKGNGDAPQDKPEDGDGGNGDGGAQGSGDDQSSDGKGDQPSDGEGAPSKGKGEPNPQGEVRDAPADCAQDGSTEGDWSAAVQQAANAAQAQGKLPGTLARFASEAAKPRVDWRSALRRFVQEVTRDDYTWTRPSGRYIARRLFLPSLHTDGMGPIMVAIDTSGSIDDVLLAQFRSEVEAIVDETSPARVHVVFCDAAVKRHDTFERDELIEFHPEGGGGTRFEPVFELAAELDEPPSCLIYLTDLAGSFPVEAPDMPVLWASTSSRTAPFGEVLEISQ